MDTRGSRKYENNEDEHKMDKFLNRGSRGKLGELKKNVQNITMCRPARRLATGNFD